MKKSLWMARLLYNNGPMSKKQIQQAWAAEDEYGRPMAHSTFYDNRKYMKELLGLHLERCDGLYYIHTADEAPALLKQILNQEETEKTLSTAADLALIYSKQIMEAIELGHRMQMEYESTHRPAYSTTFEPYCVRSIRGLLYAVGYSSYHRSVRTFALDRIATLIHTAQRYRVPEDWDADAYFRDSFGAFAGGDVQSEHIVLQVVARLGKYLKRRPLHASQKIMTRQQLTAEVTPVDDNCLCTMDMGTQHPMDYHQPSMFVTLEVGITRDLVAELLSYGPELRVLAPQHLAEMIERLHQRSCKVEG